MLFTKRRHRDETMLLYRQLGMMLSLGLSFEAALAQVEPESYKSLKKPLRALQEEVAGGASPVNVLGRHPELWGDFAFDRLAASAAPKQLGRAFQLAADQLEESTLLLQRIQRVFWYPAATTAFGLLVLMLLCIFVLPAFAAMFADFGGTLPAPTQALLLVGKFIARYSLLLMLLLVVVFSQLMRRQALFLGLIGGLPLYGPLLRKLQGYLFAKQLAELLKVDLPLDASIRFAARAAHFSAMEKVLSGTPAVGSGNALRDLFDQAAVYPKMIRQMLALATDNHGLAEVLSQTAGYSAAETERAQHRALFITEISTLLILAFLVGSTVIAMYLPIFKLAGAAGG